MGTHRLSFDFERDIDRSGSDSLKHDGRQSVFGRTDVIPLWVADMDFAAPPAVTSALAARAAHPIYGYTQYPDSLYQAQIDWLKQRHGWQVEREWIVFCPGVVPSLHAAVMAFTQPGAPARETSVIVQPPVYFPFFSCVSNTGRHVLQNPLRAEHGRYTIDFAQLRQCAANASLLLLCSPHNPVGRVWQPEELQEILRIAEEFDLTVLSDEIHADLVYADAQHRTLATLTQDPARIVTAVAPSKTFNIPGLGLSALIVPDRARREALNRAFDSLHVSAANPFSIVAFEAAYREGDAWLAALLEYLRETRNFVAGFLQQQLPEIRMRAPEGTYLLWLDCRALGMNDAQLRHFMVQDAGVGMSPGTLFGAGGEGHMRMNIGAPRHVIARALENIRLAVRNRVAAS